MGKIEAIVVEYMQEMEVKKGVKNRHRMKRVKVRFGQGTQGKRTYLCCKVTRGLF